MTADGTSTSDGGGAALPAGVWLQPAAARFRTRTEWADTWHSFSFGDHYDQANTGFGRLVAHNDDRVLAAAGYDDHPHRDTEIVTWVLSGSLVHTDSAGHRGLVYPGLAQRLSAGRGVVHAERNDAYLLDPDQVAAPVHFVQMWLLPDEPGGEPSYQQRELDLTALRGDWVPVASGAHPDAAISVRSRSSTLWAAVLGPGETRELPDARLVHLYVAGGSVLVEAVGTLHAGDALRVTDYRPLRLTGRTAAELLVWSMA